MVILRRALLSLGLIVVLEAQGRPELPLKAKHKPQLLPLWCAPPSSAGFEVRLRPGQERFAEDRTGASVPALELQTPRLQDPKTKTRKPQT